jgi:transcriptional regulator with XRE-family HTH domain
MAQRREALARRRKAIGLTQEAFASMLGVDVTSVRHWEAGRHPPLPHIRPDMARHLDVTIDELDRLLAAPGPAEPAPQTGPSTTFDFDLLRTKLTTRYHQSRNALTEPATPLTAGLALPDGTPIPTATPPAGHELDALLLAPLGQWAALDNQVGPHRLRQLANGHFGIIEAFLDNARGADFRRIAYITARHAEFAGWLSQDAGAFTDAMRWTDAALEAARLIIDPELECYILMRKSNIATDQGQTSLAIALADAACISADGLDGKFRALALRQRAHALTANRDATGALSAVDLARAQLASPDPAASDLAAYCTFAYIDMEAAACLVDLDQPGDAIPILEAGLQSWPPAFQRDLGLCLARLALAYARIREPETAASIASQSMQIVRTSGSQRTVRVLGHVTGALEAAGSHDRARMLRAALTMP